MTESRYLRGNDKLVKIFKKQRSLMEKYEKIEKANGLLQTDKVPVALDSREGQARLKDFAWRITEEMAEAINAYYTESREAFMEEMSDVLHFLTELTILTGLDPVDIIPIQPTGEIDTLDYLFIHYVVDKVDLTKPLNTELVTEFISNLGLTMNYLKNKPWKQSLKETDLDGFFNSLIWTWEVYIKLASSVGFTSEILYEAYMDKNSINKNRRERGD